MKNLIECPYCDGNAKLHRKDKEINYRKEMFCVVEHYYKCENCKEEFTTTKTDTVTMTQVYNMYRKKYNIPSLEEIIAIREQYDISATKMSEILQ